MARKPSSRVRWALNRVDSAGKVVAGNWAEADVVVVLPMRIGANGAIRVQPSAMSRTGRRVKAIDYFDAWHILAQILMRTPGLPAEQREFCSAVVRTIAKHEAEDDPQTGRIPMPS